MTLLRIGGTLPGNLYFQGWDPTRRPVDSSVVGIHHPAGSHKRISSGRVVPENSFGPGLRPPSDAYGLVAIEMGKTEPISSGGPWFSSPGVVVGVHSFGLKDADVCRTFPLPAGFTHFSAFYPSIRQYLEAGSPPPPPPPTPGRLLLNNQPETLQRGPVSATTLFNGEFSHRIEVPANADRLTITLAGDNPGVDLDLYARFGQDVGLVGGRIIADHLSAGPASNERIVIDRTSNPPLRAGVYFIATALFTRNVTARATLRAELGFPPPPPPPVGATLISGRPVEFRLPPVSSPSLFSGASAYRIDVPQGARQLDVAVTTATPGVDVDLYLRRGQPPAVVGDRVLDDYRSLGLTGNELIAIAPETGLQPGTYYAALAVWTLNAEARGQIRADIVTGPGSDPSGTRLSAIAHAASFETAAIAPGQIVSLFGNSIGPAQGVQPSFDSSGRLPVVVDGTTVLVGGRPAPLFFVRADQINAQIPYGVAGRGEVDVAVVRQGITTNVLRVQVRDAVPGLFAFGDGSNRAVAVNQNGSLNSPQNPARRGETVILFATGEGLTTGSNEEGQPALTNPLATPRLPVEIHFGGVRQTPAFAGSAPGFVGLMQINAAIPPIAPTGAAVPITVRVGEVAASVQPTISIRQ